MLSSGVLRGRRQVGLGGRRGKHLGRAAPDGGGGGSGQSGGAVQLGSYGHGGGWGCAAPQLPSWKPTTVREVNKYKTFSQL